MPKKTWKVQAKLKSKNPEKGQEKIIKTLLKNRGLKTKKQQEEFFKPKDPIKIPLKKPGISSAQIKKAIKRIKKAKKNKELVVIYGDYDADGITATAILWETLNSLGIKVMPFIPDREKHGHGLKKKGVESIIADIDKPGLIITVDNGITAFSGAKFCKKQGIDLIVCDHHQVQKSKVPPVRRAGASQKSKVNLPEAKAVVHTDKLAGAGVSWFLSREILQSQKSRQFGGQAPVKSQKLLELAAIGTIADIFPLIGINRSIVKFGLGVLKNTKRIGLKALLAEAQVDKENLSTYTIGFIIAPRLNAMGRLASGLDSLRLLCTRDEGRSVKLAFTLGQTNKDRQDLTISSFEHALESAKLQVASSKLLVISHESYEQGIVGLVAGRLVERFHRPVIVVAKREKYSKGSARSVKGFNIIEALREFEDDFVSLGGHPQAAGFTIKTEKLPEIQQKLENLALEQISEDLLSPVLKIDCQIEFSDITQELYKEIEKFEPFGFGNTKPKFLIKNVQIAEARQVGSEGKHLKLRLQQSTINNQPTTNHYHKSLSQIIFDAIYFSGGYLFEKLDYRKPIDVVFNIDENEWNGRKSLQLVVKDIKTKQ